MTALSTEALTRDFGGFRAVAGVDLALAEGARHAVIGPNGAGKTTLVNLLTGALRPTAGRVLLGGEEVTALPMHARVKRGLARTFQINQLFPEFTPEQAVTLALLEREGLTGRWWRPVAAHAAVRAEARALLDSLRFTATEMRAETHSLPYGRQRLLEIALALALKPRVLLLDEPAAGVPPGESRAVLDAVAALPRDVTVLLIEHDMDLVFRFAERITVLAQGAVLVEGPPAEIARDPRVREVYLGEAAHG
ncbi:ABC transporter ATP-binding protein [Paracraurococcus lichenis]|uniref:ATP-binding cassette domain-containing protein n=1 Tax=Paracraurococcus lichenis TaxID=3064888 RepID=A0ABT9E004_9PROT|nr:ATP-binding cassette domain-containing protein [Paracraurococcus sp. LOR1-02]MDO9709469.1 ATP-binding cassette domain-containing protein [Paracraurococcus sp. LOR1-02]